MDLIRLRTIHLGHGQHEIIRVFKADKAIALGLLAPLVPDNLGLQERGILGEGFGQCVVTDIIAKITAEDAIVICKNEKHGWRLIYQKAKLFSQEEIYAQLLSSKAETYLDPIHPEWDPPTPENHKYATSSHLVFLLASELCLVTH